MKELLQKIQRDCIDNYNTSVIELLFNNKHRLRFLMTPINDTFLPDIDMDTFAKKFKKITSIQICVACTGTNNKGSHIIVNYSRVLQKNKTTDKLGSKTYHIVNIEQVIYMLDCIESHLRQLF